MTCFCKVTVAPVQNVVTVTSPGPQGTPGVQGDPGTPAPELDIQYSADNSSWSDSYTAGDFYARFSTDGGSTWGSGLLIRGEQGIQGDEGPIGNTGPQGPAGTPAPALEIEYSADEVSWSPTYTTGDYYARFSVDGGSTWGAGLLFRGPQGETGLTGAEGPQGPQGTQGPEGAQGVQGIQGPEGAQGPQGIQGPAGTDGIDGRTILSGSVDPTIEGADGDYYINTSTWKIFGPKATAWPAGVDIVGADGAPGADGTNGTNGTDGKTVLGGTVDPTTEGVDGDWYINHISWHIWEKVSGTWTDRGSIKGADQGVPTGGTTGQILAKSSSTDYATEWVDAPSGSGGVSLGLVIALS